VIAAASYPAGQSHCGSGLPGTQSAGAVGAHHELHPFQNMRGSGATSSPSGELRP